MIVSRPMPAPASAGMAALPIPPAPTIATLAAFSLRWPDAADLRKDDVPGVAVELVVAEVDHRRCEPKPPLPRSVSSSSCNLGEVRAKDRRRNQLGDPLAAADLERPRRRDW